MCRSGDESDPAGVERGHDPGRLHFVRAKKPMPPLMNHAYTFDAPDTHSGDLYILDVHFKADHG